MTSNSLDCSPKTKTILCLSRSYLSRLLPALQAEHTEATYHHIVQSDREAKAVEDTGGLVVLNLEETVRIALSNRDGHSWIEPSDMRRIAGFDWCAIHSDRYLHQFDQTTRSLIAGALQCSVTKIFKQCRYDAFISEPVALFITHLIFYHCRLSGTRPLLWCSTYYPGDFYFVDAAEASTPVRRAERPASEIDRLKSVVNEFVNGVVTDTAGPVYHHSFSEAKTSKWSYFKQRRGEAPPILQPGWESKVIQTARLLRCYYCRFLFPRFSDYMTAGSVNEHKYYLNCLLSSRKDYDAIPVEYSVDNVVFPLQFEPEASLLYFAPYILSQITFVETILRCLPAGKVLWVKEHPNQFGALQTSDWRALKKRYSNVKYIYGRDSGRVLVRRASLVVTITSTMGLDALLLGRVVLVAGQVFYSSFTGVVRTPCYSELAVALNDYRNYAHTDNFSTNTEELFRFGKSAFLGSPHASMSLYSKENLERLVRAIRSQVDFERNEGIQ